MKTPFLTAALGLLAVSNLWVLIHVARNRTGTPDAELELTARELRYSGAGNEDSTAVLTLTYQNPAGPLAWFDRNKLAELGFDTSVPVAATNASNYYTNSRSREVFVALEYDGPTWQQWIQAHESRESKLQQETAYSPEISLTDRIEIERQTASRLFAIDAALDPAALRAKYPDGKHVMIMRAQARVMLDYPPALRGIITHIATDSINIPANLRSNFNGQAYYSPYTFEKQQVKITPPPYAATLRVGSNYEPSLESVRLLP